MGGWVRGIRCCRTAVLPHFRTRSRTPVLPGLRATVLPYSCTPELPPESLPNSPSLPLFPLQIPRLGMTRLKLVNLLEAMLRVDVPQIDEAIKENGVLILALGRSRAVT